MSLEPFHGNTFVAFTDIAGFKQMMRDRQRAARALDALYSSGYRVLHTQPQHGSQVAGLFVSDCGILYVNSTEEPHVQLAKLCEVVARLNRSCFNQAVLLSTSIAFGEFDYQQRIEFKGIEKNLIVGSAYLAAYLDQAGGEPRLYAPEARILKSGLPESAEIFCRSKIGSKMREESAHFYFEWMREDDAHQLN